MHFNHLWLIPTEVMRKITKALGYVLPVATLCPVSLRVCASAPHQLVSEFCATWLGMHLSGRVLVQSVERLSSVPSPMKPDNKRALCDQDPCFTGVLSEQLLNVTTFHLLLILSDF